MKISAEDRAAIEAAFDAAQARTRAPLIGVAAEASSDYGLAPMAWSLALALLVPWPLLVFTALSAERVFAAQLAVCLAALAVFSLAPVRVALNAKRTQRAYAHRAALAQFSARGLDRAPHDGVLIYVSLAERYARVIAGDEACKFVTAAQWQGLIDALIADMQRAGLNVALGAAAARAADLLAPHFPPNEGPASVGARFHSV